jgi:REP element-mobilizing transposase RayT
MARKPRIHFPGAIYHAMARGVDGRDIYMDDHDRLRFLDGMRRIERETSAEIIAYCLMGNHFHLAIKVAIVPLSFIMQRMESGYCSGFNRRHGRTGHLFQARYKAFICLTDRYFAGLIPYIHMNPVRAGLVASPQDWPWSSYKPTTHGEVVDPEFNPWPEGTLDIDLTRSPIAEPADLDAIGAAAASSAGVSSALLRGSCRKRGVVAARRQFVGEVIRLGGTQVAAAKWLNSTRSSVSRYARENTATTGDLTP